MANTAETPDIVYGRLLESAHISGYSFERVCDELSWLLDEDRWQQVGGGYDDINAFVATIDGSAFKLDQKKVLANKLAALQAKQTATAAALGVTQGAVSHWTKGRAKPADITGNSLPLAVAEELPSDQAEREGASPAAITSNSAALPAPPEVFQRPPLEVAEQVRKSARKDQAAAETHARREASRNADPLTDTLDLRIGDAREVLADVADASVALVLTDPPYGDASGPLYEWLGEWAARVLVPGGSLVCYTGQSRLDRDMRALGAHLRYWWLLSMMHNSSQRLPGKFVVAEFKPVLWYVKDHRRGRTLVTDVLRPVAKDKAAHDWGQGEGGAGLLIEQLTDPGELVADPFAGSARWGLLSQQMGRRWVGADIAEGGSTEIVS